MKSKIFITLVFLFTMGSCKKYLDVVPDNVATIDNAFSMRSTAEKFLFTCYSYLPKGGNYIYDPALLGADEMWSPKTTWASLSVVRSFQNVVDPFFNYWGGEQGGTALYQGLRDCNIFLDNINRVLDLDELERRRWMAEVKFLKAYYHFYLLRTYGPIPLIKTNLPISTSIEEVQVKRASIDEGFNYILELLDEAIPELPDHIDADATELGRITSIIALSMKAKILVTAASPLFNGNSDYASFKDKQGMIFFNQAYNQNKWSIAAESCKEAIEAAHKVGHKLYYYKDNDPNSLLVSKETNLTMNIRNSITSRWNTEIIWGNTSSLSAVNQKESQPRLDGNTPGFSSTSGTLSPTMKMVEMFYSANGVPIQEDTNWDYPSRFDLKTAVAGDKYYIKQGYQTAKLHFSREPRFYADLGFDGAIWYGQGKKIEAESWYVQAKFGQYSGGIPSNGYSSTGYWPKKIVNPENVYSATVNYTIVNYPHPEIRLADLYLLYAEALNENNGPSSEVFQYLDLVRARAGLLGVEESWTKYSTNPNKFSTKEGLREIIHQERAIELAFEAHRAWDLKRWKTAIKELNYYVQGWNTLQSEAAAYYTPVTIFQRKYALRDYFTPIKELDLVTNPNLVQNPGW